MCCVKVSVPIPCKRICQARHNAVICIFMLNVMEWCSRLFLIMRKHVHAYFCKCTYANHTRYIRKIVLDREKLYFTNHRIFATGSLRFKYLFCTFSNLMSNKIRWEEKSKSILINIKIIVYFLPFSLLVSLSHNFELMWVMLACVFHMLDLSW